MVPVCSPALLKKPIKKAHELLAYPLLHSTTRPDGWSQWFASLGVEDNATMQGVRYELHTMLTAGAAAGLGIALVPRFLVEGQLKHLGLVIPFELPAARSGGNGGSDAAYYLVHPTEFSHGKPLEAFRTWLLEQAGAYASVE